MDLFEPTALMQSDDCFPVCTFLQFRGVFCNISYLVLTFITSDKLMD